MPKRLDPLIEGLLAYLPPADSVWPQAERDKWLTALKTNMTFVYPETEEPEPEPEQLTPAPEPEEET